METVTVQNLDDLDHVLRRVRIHLTKHGATLVTFHKASKRRTVTQNASLHKYCENIANGMDNAGYTQRQLVGSFKEGFELPVTETMIKDIFREVGFAMFKKKSTTELTTTEIQDVYRVVDQRFMEITGVGSPWPSVDSMREESLKR